MKILNEYPGSHHYWDEYEKTEYFCAKCGKQEVWESTGPGDYYVGNEALCTACGHGCHYMNGPSPAKDANELGILEQLRSGVTKDPTTRRGN